MQPAKPKSVSVYRLLVWLIVRGGWVGALLGFLLVPALYAVVAWIDPVARRNFLITLLQLLCYITPFSALTGAALGTAINLISGVTIYFATSKSHGNLTRLREVMIGSQLCLGTVFLISLPVWLIHVKAPITLSGIVFLIFTCLALVSLWYMLVIQPFIVWYQANSIIRKQSPST